MSDPSKCTNGQEVLDALHSIRETVHRVVEMQTSLTAGVERIVFKFDQFQSAQVKTQAEIMDRIDRLQGTIELGGCTC
jgi:hypothetical protein